ncbi:glycoside/pentoside/hexuronide:cation symporter, GPH family [Robiginitalea myxolifaciens]|uniref:Glycoside/pentoside/hexuronide:cation symporter, GPH family n=1 Tax=Robiginitalea myxolifaciens TaxID=400055 RepID=A0A1I6GCJ1_9FLAO|nr:MFS transporter [Robiginitalea myxolifaciens]SFR39912.1 glycoside/pentoside/hexuronide:cation symporter, GPH family [Robiginitalea myxolifaciens]
MESNVKISLREKLAYGAGDFASSMFWKLFSMFLLFFYTDVFGISAATVGTMFLVTRIWDAVNDPVMGVICDRTRSRWGKFRPYLLYLAIPFALIGVLTFTNPGLSGTAKVVYAYVTYTLMMMVYTGVNVPYASLMAVMTSNIGERTSLASWRLIGAFSGGLFVTLTANYLVEYFGANSSGGVDYGKGYQWAITVFGILAATLLILTFLGTRERLEPPKEAQSSLKEDIRNLLRNGPWFILLGAAIFNNIFNTLRDGTTLYYFKYFIQDQSLALFGESYDFSHGALASAYLSVWVGTNIIGVIIAKPLATRFGKKRTFFYSILLSSLLSIAFYFLQADQLVAIFALNILIGISAGIVMPLLWAMYADIADYSEWKNGKRSTGLIFSSSSMSQKFGWTIGGALTGWILSFLGFEANVAQTDVAIQGIRLMISVLAGVAGIIAALFVRSYKLDESTMEQIQKDLKIMRK